MAITLSTRPFGRLDGRSVAALTLESATGVSATVCAYGARLLSLEAPDREGRLGSIVLGFDDLDRYRASRSYLGATCGRVANRIRGARFTLDGQVCQLDANERANTLHGGQRGFDKQVWDVVSAGPEGVVFRLLSPSGDMGFPGAVTAEVAYTLSSDGALTVAMTAETDAPTAVNLVNHSYYNLSAGAAPTIDGHVLRLWADRFTPTDAALIPTGEVRLVDGTPLDFRAPAEIGPRRRRIGPDGFDHNLVLSDAPGAEGLRPVADLRDPASGRRLTLATTAPGVQFYSGGRLAGGPPGRGDQVYGAFGGLCLETQNFPDSPNQPGFPPVWLRPGERYRHVMRVTTGVD